MTDANFLIEIAKFIDVLESIRNLTIIRGIELLRQYSDEETSKKIKKQYGDWFIPTKLLRKKYGISCFAQLLHFFNPDRELFIPVGFSGDGDFDKDEMETIKWIFPTYNATGYFGPLWQIYQDYLKGTKSINIFQIVEEMDKKSLIKNKLSGLRFTSFLIVPIVLNKLLGTVTIFFINPLSFCGCTDKPDEAILEQLANEIQLFFARSFSDLHKIFETAKIKGEPIESLGQSRR